MNPKNIHKLVRAVFCALALSSVPASAVLINFESDFYLSVIDSQGDTITDSMGYIFQLGAFDNGFVPVAGNKDQWADNWVVFTELAYTQPLLGEDPPVTGYKLAGSANLMPDKLPSVPYTPGVDPVYRDPADVGGYSSWYRLPSGEIDPVKPVAGSTFDFSGLKGYLWIYDSADPANARAEQFLGSSSEWIFPDKLVETAVLCCDNRDPLNWSISQIDESPPIGEKPPGLPETLQLIPEPGSSLLALAGALALLGRRRRA
jgi:hypothetical protein